jgi:hypothetical protein
VVGLEAKRLMFEYPVEEWFHGEYAAIPEHMQEAIRRYVVERIAPGDFLRAVLENNLSAAVGRADDENLKLLRTYVRFFYNRVPAQCSGSPAAVSAWLTNK